MTWQELAGRRADGGSCPARVSRFVGREPELAAISGALAGPPAVGLIEGEPGIGKSRLLREYLSSPPGQAHTALVACCPPIRRPHTLGPVTDALRQAAGNLAGLPLTSLAGSLRALFPEWAHSLPPPPEQAEDATAARHRLFRALCELVGCLGISLVIAEDAHWADEATLEFLLYLASLEPRRFSLVVTYRPEDVPAGSLLPRLSRLAAGPGGLRLGLGPLDAAGTRALVSSLLAAEQVPAEFTDRVHQRTEGVPLAVEETIRLLADRADLARRDGGWVPHHLAEIAVPPSIRDAVLERVSRLSGCAQTMLRTAAVLGETAGEATLGPVSALPAPEASRGLTEAERSGLLVEDARGRVSYRHVLAAQAVYDATPGPERREMHRRAGDVLERHCPLPVASLARHFREAGEVSKWCGYATQAGELALAAGDETTAVALVRDLIDGAYEYPACCRHVDALLDKITFVSVTDPACYSDLTQALHALIEAGKAAPPEEAELRYQRGRVLDYMQEHEAARAELELALPHLAAEPARAARAMNLLGWPHDTVSPASAHLHWLRRAERIAQSVTPAERLPLLVQRVTALLLLGEEEGWTAAADLTGQAIAGRDMRRVTVGQLNVGELAMTWGRYADARRWLAEALVHAEANHYRRYRELIRSNQAHLDWLTGGWESLAERVAGMMQDDREVNSRLEAALVAGLLYAATGVRDQAEKLLSQVLTEREKRGGPYFFVEPAAALARLMLGDGRVEQALRITSDPVAAITAKGTWIWATDIVPARVEALLAGDHLKEAVGLADVFASGLRGCDAPAPRAAVALCRAALARAQGQHSRAAALFARLAVAWRSLPRPYDALLAQEYQSGCLYAAGNPDASTALLTTVYQGFSELGAAGDASRVARRLRDRQGPPARPRRGGRRSYGRELSPRELDVARLLVAGGTNREIGQQLFLSPKTVARHLDSAMRKLGVSSRTALAVKLVEDGVVSRGASG